ncbi:MAG: hypothetical protein ABSE49_03590 [Polyangiaceae bacterium]
MPKLSEPPPPDLDEVERALSVLGGRHPEHERIRRETMAAAEERRQALDKDLAASARRRRRRRILLAAAALAVIASAVTGWRFFARERSLRAELDRVETPFVAHGMKELASNELLGRSPLELDAPASSCFVAVATSGTVRARQGPMTAEAPGSVGWCACGEAHVVLEAAEGAGLALLRAEARQLGGPLARPWSEVTPAAWADGGNECADAALDGWLADHRWPAPPLETSWLDAPARASLRREGFRVISGVAPGRPFALVEPAAGSCTLAVASRDDALSLRAPAGPRPIALARGALAWCSSSADAMTVWREGSAGVVVLSAPAASIGGLLGVRECAEAAGTHVPAQASWLREEDLAWDAASLLRVSALAGVTTAALPAVPGPTSTKVTALDLSTGAEVMSDPSSVVVACDPPFEAPSVERTSVCAVTAPVAWWRKTGAPAAMAQAPLPFWLSLFESHHEPDAVARVPELLTLARRLVRAGFVPTVLEGVTELSDGVRVVGRAGEDRVVAVGLGPKAPWVFPYTDGVAWDLGDPPRVVPLEPGLAVKLATTPLSNAPIEKRRTVVFRHATRP